MSMSIKINNSAERVPPQNVELEMCVLGAVMLEPQAAYPLAKERLSKESFYLDGHGIVFEIMGELHEQGIPPDSVAVLDTLRARGLVERIGGSGVLMGMLNSVPTAASIEHHAELLAEKALGRNLIRGCTRIIDEAYRQELKVERLIELAEQTVRHLSLSTGKSGDIWTVDDLVDDLLATFDARCDEVERLKQGGKDPCQLIGGLSTGFPNLDRSMGGLNKSELTIIAARPSMGKSALALNIADNIAQEHRVGFISLEMDRESLMRRLVSAETHRLAGPYCVDTRSMQNPGDLSKQEIHIVRQATWNLKTRHGDRLWIVDDCPAEFGAVIRTARAMLRDGAEAIFLDYLQLLSATGNLGQRDNINRNLEIASYTNRLKGLAREYDVPIILLSQLSRENERAGAKPRPPRLSDLRESGAIEQDADVVLFIWAGTTGWGEEEDARSIASGVPEPSEGSLIIGKQRNGPTGWHKIRFLKQASRFLPPAERSTV